MWDEHVLALDLYMQNPRSPPGKKSEPIKELSALLNAMGRKAGVAMTPKFRNANGVYQKLMNFRRFDPAFQSEGKVGLTHGNKMEKAVWDAYADDLPGLAARAAAIRLAIEDDAVSLAGMDADPELEAEEGAVVLRLHYSRERNPKLARQKKDQALKATGRLECEVCEFDFASRYGPHGDGFIEAHHRKLVSALKKGEKTKLADLALVCANCHRMLHRGGNLLGVDELKTMLRPT
jgi:5-methylcytosine-specific restriction protein A